MAKKPEAQNVPTPVATEEEEVYLYAIENAPIIAALEGELSKVDARIAAIDKEELNRLTRARIKLIRTMESYGWVSPEKKAEQEKKAAEEAAKAEAEAIAKAEADEAALQAAPVPEGKTE